jgi:hypothetical protein
MQISIASKIYLVIDIVILYGVNRNTGHIAVSYCCRGIAADYLLRNVGYDTKLDKKQLYQGSDITVIFA